jgi:K+-sensing histidine kinase KdpD
MGLGLYAAKIQISGMDGNIVAENREGGVAFVITLPLSKGAQVT